ncbi:MAG TPA: hypothetical protein VIR58_15530 [Acidimicrobiales bacterium]
MSQRPSILRRMTLVRRFTARLATENGARISPAASAETLPGARFPLDRCYSTSAIIGLAVWLVALAAAWPRSSLRLGPPTPELARYEAESVDAEVAGAVMYEPDAARPTQHRDGLDP